MNSLDTVKLLNTNMNNVKEKIVNLNLMKKNQVRNKFKAQHIKIVKKERVLV